MDMAEQKLAVLIRGAICALIIHAQEKHCWVAKVVQIGPESIKTAAYKIENVLWVEEGRDLPEEALVPNCLVAECYDIQITEKEMAKIFTGTACDHINKHENQNLGQWTTCIVVLDFADQLSEDLSRVIYYWAKIQKEFSAKQSVTINLFPKVPQEEKLFSAETTSRRKFQFKQ